MKTLTILTILLLSATAALSQTDLPEYGKMPEIQNKTKFYLIADGESKKAVLKKVKAPLTIVDRSEDAEFFLEYKTLSRQPFGILPGATTETGQMDAYYLRDKKKIIVWSESGTGGGFKGDSANKLFSKFLKAFTKISK